MKFCLAVPTYWTFAGGRGEEEIFFDHPTPLDSEGTLGRCLDSLRHLVTPQVGILVVAVPAQSGLAGAVAARVAAIVANSSVARWVRLVSVKELEHLRQFCRSQGREGFLPLLSLDSYGAIRNLTLALANLLSAEVLVSLDDDELIRDADFLGRLGRDLEVLAPGRALFGLAGLYENPAGGILAPEPQGEWVEHWPKMRRLNQAFQMLAAAPDPLPLTPLALGGNMAIPAALYRFLPFDPALPRGEDTDYVLNARMFGIPFFLDAGLRVVHEPPDKPHPLWLRLRQDLQRFWYTRQKLLAQEPGLVPSPVSPEDFMPYPGTFLTSDLELRAYRTHTVLAAAYLRDGDVNGAQETLANLRILTAPPVGRAALSTYLQRVAEWRRLQSWLARPGVREGALEAIWG